MSRTPRITQPNEFFPLASEEMIRRGEISDAVEHCRRGLIFYPDNISGYAVLANAYLLLEEPTRAANVLRDGFRRTGADRLLELADLLEAEQTVSDQKLSPVVDLSHVDAEEQAADNPEVEQSEPEELSFITDDPTGPHYVSDPTEEAADLYPYDSDERENGDYHQELTDRMIARSDQSLFGNAGGPISRDLFTGEPLPSDRAFFEPEEEEGGIENSELRIENGGALAEGNSELRMKNEDRERGDQEGGERAIGEETVEKAGGEEAEEVEDVEDGRDTLDTADVEDDSEEVEIDVDVEARVVRPEDPTAGMAAGGGRSETGDLADLIDEDSDRMLDEGGPGVPSGLSLHSGTQISDLRSRNLRLIPGLEYAPLRKDEGSMKIAPLVDERKRFGMPPLGERPTTPLSEGPERSDRNEEKNDSGQTDEKGSLTPLEELARRLETARIPAVHEEPEVDEPSSFEPSLVSDTFAGILVSQGAYAEAIKAYQMLARLKPERREEYEKKIAEVRWQMGRVES